MTTVRLQKVLARAGVASRRAAEEMIAAGRVRVDGRVVTQLGTKVDPRTSRVEVDGERVVRETATYVVLHKPRGVVSTMHDPEGRPTVGELLSEVPGRVFPVGRLDFNTSGVLVATNDGEFSDALLHPRRAVPKTYVVKVQGTMEVADVDRWRHGVELDDGKTQPAKVRVLRHETDKTWLELTITEGRNQQVRRMGEATGFRVMRLARVAFAGLAPEGLAPGRWRYLTPDELRALKKEYGVPRRIVTPPADPGRDPGKRAPLRPRGPEVRPPDAEGRQRTHGPEGRQRPSGAEARQRGGSGAETRQRGSGAEARQRPSGAEARQRPSRPEGRQRAPRPEGQQRPSAPEGGRRARGQDGRGLHPRYGGGSPARRDIGVSEDWGGGVRRGASGPRDTQGDPGDRPPRGDVGGRGGTTRTTGTSGGVGASGGDYRVRSRRRES